MDTSSNAYDAYHIRKAVISDIDALIDLCAEHAAFEGASYQRAGKAEKLAAHLFQAVPHVSCLVVGKAGQLVGYATYMQEFATWDAAYYMHMDCLFLRPEARGQGLGKQLVLRIAQDAVQQGCVNVQWQTPASNTAAIAFYKRLGAVEKEKQRFYLVM